MLLNFYNSFRPDKTVDHPILGEISCSGYQEAFKKCQEVMSQKSNFSMNCYRSETNEEFLGWINQKFDERKKLNQFLRENGSIQPKLQSRNMFYDVFITNADNQQQTAATNAQNDEQIQRYFREQMQRNKGFFDGEFEEE